MNEHSPGLKISVVICTYNRDKFIGTALQKLTEQSLPAPNFEVIIVDNRSTDNTAQICQEFIATHQHLNFRYVYEASKGLSFARNRGCHEAASPIITYIDDDAEATPKFLESIVGFLNKHNEAVGLGGRVIPIYPDTSEPAWMNPFLNGFVGRVDFGENPTVFHGKMKYPAGCNMTYKKEVIQRVGGFNNELTFRSDDKYIYYQVTKVSSCIYYLPEATVYHNIDKERLAFSSFRKLFLKTGNEEKVRIRTEKGGLMLVKKFAELLFKFGASLLIYLKYLVSGKEIKGRYIVWAQWFTLKGFLRKNVFVR